MKSKSTKVWVSTLADIQKIGEKKIWSKPVVVDQAVKALKEKLKLK